MKPLLSIIIPVRSNSHRFLSSVLSRLSINKIFFPDHVFEVIVIDCGDKGPTRELCETMAKIINLKYIYLPTTENYCELHARNVGFRVSEGKVICSINYLDWVSENFVYGVLSPFVYDDEFEYKLENKKIKESSLKAASYQPNNIVNHGHRGLVYSSKLITGKDLIEEQCLKLQAINQKLIDNPSWEIMDVYKQAQLDFHSDEVSYDIWATRRGNVFELNGCDEFFAHTNINGNKLEKSDFTKRLDGLVSGHSTEQINNFNTIYMYNDRVCSRAKQVDQTEIYEKSKARKTTLCYNKTWWWGKTFEGSFGIINEKILNPKELEEWICEYVEDAPSYFSHGDIWESPEQYINMLEKYRNEV